MQPISRPSSLGHSTLKPTLPEKVHSPRISRGAAGASSLSIGALAPTGPYEHKPQLQRFSRKMDAAQRSGVQTYHVTAGSEAPLPPGAAQWAEPEGQWAGCPSRLAAKLQKDRVDEGRHFFGQPVFPRRDDALEPSLSSPGKLSALGLKHNRGHWQEGASVVYTEAVLTPRRAQRSGVADVSPPARAVPAPVGVRESVAHRATFDGSAAKVAIFGGP